VDSEQIEPTKEYWIGDAVKVAVLTAIAYAGAFFYEFGYATYFGMPYYFIEVSIVQIIVMMALVLSLVLFIVGVPSALSLIN